MSTDNLIRAHNVIDDELRWHEDGLCTSIAHVVLDRYAEEHDGNDGVDLSAYAKTLCAVVEDRATELQQALHAILVDVESRARAWASGGPKGPVVPSSGVNEDDADNTSRMEG